ncbi:peptidoglycan DD-metalloendopeptidase family protein [Ramlibacter sp. MMS24-I3-19]|uniref:peptidoglycan DD-metalloendopeptidase family protein n=1 Tax=Ramlibacter sp. MMS24-I3-19 TaxID=3416606 RepID=UPI003CFEE37A
MASALLVVAVLAGCASKHRAPAPVEDRSSGVRAPVVASGEPVKNLPGAENAGKPGYYTVRQGDTLIRIALEQGQNWRDIVRWNALDNPNVIETGQVLRVAPPAEAVVARPIAPAVITASAATPAVGTASAASAVASAPRPAASAAVAAPSVPAATPEDDIAWGWPAPGNSSVLATFDEVKNKGLDIAGKAGDPVLAAADGRVVYAGAGLRGYGNLLILKHNNIYLTAYAHNQTLLVKEDQTVRKGQKIAEMGASDADRVKLHFEIRRQGKPVDPARFLQAAR